MSTIVRSAVALGLVTLVCACAAPSAPPTTAQLTYKSSPEGAELFEGKQSLGMAPVTRTYKGDGKSESVTTTDVTAVWPSGARTSFFTILPLGADREAMLERPTGAPGLQVDLDNAKKAAESAARRERESKEAMTTDDCKGPPPAGGLRPAYCSK